MNWYNLDLRYFLFASYLEIHSHTIADYFFKMLVHISPCIEQRATADTTRIGITKTV